MDHIKNDLHQLLKKLITTKIKTKTLKQVTVLKDNEFIDNKDVINVKDQSSNANNSTTFFN